ncbi:MAG: hypothetical protein ABFD97_17485 [Syntrophobacter sp.]
MLDKKFIYKLSKLDLLSVFVTFMDELAFFNDKTVSMASTTVSENTVLSTFNPHYSRIAQAAPVKPNSDAMLRALSDFGSITHRQSKLRWKIQLTHGLYRAFPASSQKAMSNAG